MPQYTKTFLEVYYRGFCHAMHILDSSDESSAERAANKLDTESKFKAQYWSGPDKERNLHWSVRRLGLWYQDMQKSFHLIWLPWFHLYCCTILQQSQAQPSNTNTCDIYICYYRYISNETIRLLCASKQVELVEYLTCKLSKHDWKWFKLPKQMIYSIIQMIFESRKYVLIREKVHSSRSEPKQWRSQQECSPCLRKVGC